MEAVCVELEKHSKDPEAIRRLRELRAEASKRVAAETKASVSELKGGMANAVPEEGVSRTTDPAVAKKAPRAKRKTLEMRESGPESLEKEDFRIDSAGWKTEKLQDGTRVKRNPEGDVTELLDGPFKGAQHFTQEAALRETAKAGKRMPTKEEWIAAIKAADPSVEPGEGWQASPGTAAKLGIKLAGFRDGSTVACYYQGTVGNYWSSSTDEIRGCFVNFSYSGVNPTVQADKSLGLSVRCLKN